MGGGGGGGGGGGEGGDGEGGGVKKKKKVMPFVTSDKTVLKCTNPLLPLPPLCSLMGPKSYLRSESLSANRQRQRTATLITFTRK